MAIWPFVSRSSLPQATDAELHIYRLAELARLFRAGEAFPRWAPNFYYGYGYPIFNYYAPLSYYVALIPELLPMFDAVAAVKFVFVVGIVLGGLGTYGFSARNWGRLPALVATAAYVYSPFLVFVEPHARGDLAEAFSFGIFPMALWALDRLRTRPGATNWLLAVIFVALIVLSHNLMALVFTAILAGWILWAYAFSDVPSATEGLSSLFERLVHLRLLLALALGIGVAAFFWLTVALEQDAVNFGSLIGVDDNFDFRNHFLSAAELVAPAKLMDWAATEPDYVLSLGSAQVLLALIGMIAGLAGKVHRRRQVAFFALAAATLVFLMLPASRIIWETIPYLPFLQFPWRLLGPAAFAVAILAAAGTDGLMAWLRDRAARWLPAAFIGLIMISALPLVQVPPWPDDFGPTTALRVVQEELTGRWLGTTSTSDFVPVTVDVIPRPEGSLLEDFTAGRPLDRVNRQTLPAGSEVLSEEITPLHFRYTVKSPEAFHLRLFLFDFPGWKVRVDGEAARTELGRPEGFIVVPVSSGEHVVEVEFGDTGERQLAYLVSALCASLAIGFAFMLRFKRDRIQSSEAVPPAGRQGKATDLAAVALAAIVITGFNGMLVEPNGWLRHDSPPLSAVPAMQSQYAELGGQIALIGFDAPEKARAGETIPVTVYWQALRPLETNYQVFVHLADSDGQIVAQSDAINPGSFPTENWPIDRYVRDEHEVLLPEGLPSGDYIWSVGLWLAAEGERLPVVDADGQPAGDRVQLRKPLIIE